MRNVKDIIFLVCIIAIPFLFFTFMLSPNMDKALIMSFVAILGAWSMPEVKDA